MQWNLLTAQNLAIIDQEVSGNKFSSAEYEIVRRIIYESGDLDYYSLVSFSNDALSSGMAGLNARIPIIVDTSIIQKSVFSSLQLTFFNPVYSIEDISISDSVSMLENLARRYPSAIYVFGKNQMLLTSLLDFMPSQEILPSLIVTTVSGFIHKEAINMKLRDSSISHIRVDSCKGGVNLAVAIIDGLIDLAWTAKQLTLNN